MNTRPQSELDQLRAAHPDKWAQLAAAGFKAQRIAEVITTQAAEAARQAIENPPEKIAAAKLKAAQEVVKVHENRAALAKAELQKLTEEIRAEFPDLVSEPTSEQEPASSDSQEAPKKAKKAK